VLSTLIASTAAQVVWVFAAYSNPQDFFSKAARAMEAMERSGRLGVSFLFLFGMSFSATVLAMSLLFSESPLMEGRSPKGQRPLHTILIATGISLFAPLIWGKLRDDLPQRFGHANGIVPVMFLLTTVLAGAYVWFSMLVARSEESYDGGVGRSVEFAAPFLFVGLLCFIAFNLIVPRTDDKVRAGAIDYFLQAVEKEGDNRHEVRRVREAIRSAGEEGLSFTVDELLIASCRKVNVPSCVRSCLTQLPASIGYGTSDSACDALAREYARIEQALPEKCVPTSDAYLRRTDLVIRQLR